MLALFLTSSEGHDIDVRPLSVFGGQGPSDGECPVTDPLSSSVVNPAIFQIDFRVTYDAIYEAFGISAFHVDDIGQTQQRKRHGKSGDLRIDILDGAILAGGMTDEKFCFSRPYQFANLGHQLLNKCRNVGDVIRFVEHKPHSRGEGGFEEFGRMEFAILPQI
ncbi:hypothetical protein AB0J82_39205 [Asanoa sp. NPDC049518]|uniref:hypothetical protein n=1 Tax=unclassified Asanoa TaxID=2685164 RepID=UPI003431A06B